MVRDRDQMTNGEVRSRIVRLAFDNDEELFETFREKLRAGLPPGTGVALRGSVITDERYKDSKPFDTDGKGTSDLDVTLIGNDVMEHWSKDSFYIPKLHTKPLGDDDPNVAPALDPLRRELQQLVKRPVNFQATANIILFTRDVLFNQPYYTLIETGDDT
jgi:hypothetical protein